MNKDIFKPRVNILPYEYPQLLAYKDAIRHSYWIDTEFNFTEDIQDFKVTISNEEKDVIKKTMLAIAQIEVNVKTFWGDLYKRMPITEVGDVGFTFAESEVRHKDAYARLLRILGLEKEFQSVVEVPAIEGRLKYLKKYLDGTRSRDNKMYTKSDFTTYNCLTCDNTTNFAKVEIPYAYKLMSQELQTINVVPRLITED